MIFCLTYLINISLSCPLFASDPSEFYCQLRCLIQRRTNLYSVVRMGMYDGTVPCDHPRLRDVDRRRVWEVVCHAPKLLQHPKLSSDIIGAILEGVKCCQDYLKDPVGMSDSVYAEMRAFLDDYANSRAFWCHSEFRALLVSAVPAVYEIAKIEESSLPSNIRDVVEHFTEYGDFF